MGPSAPKSTFKTSNCLAFTPIATGSPGRHRVPSIRVAPALVFETPYSEVSLLQMARGYQGQTLCRLTTNPRETGRSGPGSPSCDDGYYARPFSCHHVHTRKMEIKFGFLLGPLATISTIGRARFQVTGKVQIVIQRYTGARFSVMEIDCAPCDWPNAPSERVGFQIPAIRSRPEPETEMPERNRSKSITPDVDERVEVRPLNHGPNPAAHAPALSARGTPRVPNHLFPD